MLEFIDTANNNDIVVWFNTMVWDGLLLVQVLGEPVMDFTYVWSYLHRWMTPTRFMLSTLRKPPCRGLYRSQCLLQPLLPAQLQHQLVMLPMQLLQLPLRLHRSLVLWKVIGLNSSGRSLKSEPLLNLMRKDPYSICGFGLSTMTLTLFALKPELSDLTNYGIFGGRTYVSRGGLCFPRKPPRRLRSSDLAHRSIVCEFKVPT